MITNTSRTFGLVNKIDAKLLSLMAKFCSVLNACLRLIWGSLYDKLGFKKLYFTALIIEVI